MKSMINEAWEMGKSRDLKECKYLGLCINKGGCEKYKGDKIFEV